MTNVADSSVAIFNSSFRPLSSLVGSTIPAVGIKEIVLVRILGDLDKISFVSLNFSSYEWDKSFSRLDEIKNSVKPFEDFYKRKNAILDPEWVNGRLFF